MLEVTGFAAMGQAGPASAASTDGPLLLELQA
jgi:hypothetical protein